MLVCDLAKLIKQNGVNIGGNRLWEWLREKGYIFKHSCEPTQKSMDLKLFEVVERTIQRSGHAPKVTRTTRVTGKGQSRIKKNRRCKGK
ncbi:phage antirepressor KilAC domain-containing protein [Bulleidia sp. zg-1006]|uniref:phage antirepressor KilAC domain-containing protein n=1 Tax=Bulleidia sp. zg-1006 TaxID=2806552 RepID=UPI0019398857|nr:phage antirepressor KilAC domain-containing protein [Bulleidia sp. zg-1006]